MKDEIKEFNEEKYVEMLEDGTLYDYITNLKQIEQDHQKLNGELREELEDYKSRNEKAIELIKKDREKNYDTLEKKAFYCNKTNKLLNILQGDDKDGQ